jgi:hypothetical protein
VHNKYYVPHINYSYKKQAVLMYASIIMTMSCMRAHTHCTQYSYTIVCRPYIIMDGSIDVWDLGVCLMYMIIMSNVWYILCANG